MQRIFGRIALLILVLALVPLPAQGATWADEAAAPTVQPDDEVVVLEWNGRIRIDDPHQEPNVSQVTWDSGSDIGWTAVEAGDFNGDGDDELVAIQGGRIKVFDPIEQPGRARVAFELYLDGSRAFRLLTTGDFDGDGKAEIAATHTETGVNLQEALKIYDGGANGTQWTTTRELYYGALWQGMSAGDVNADGADDLAMVRNPLLSDPLLTLYNGRTWTPLVERYFNFPFLALAVGKLSLAHPGEQIALTRTGEILALADSLLLLRYVNNALDDLLANTNYRYYPHFTSVAVGDVNGDGDDEVLMVRDPTDNRTSLLLVNPAGQATFDLDVAIGFGATAWKQVRAGDVDADGRDEVLLLRADRYRTYVDPQSNANYIDVVGSYRIPQSGTDVSAFCFANVDGGGKVLGPVMSVSPTSLTFSVEYGQTSPVRTVNITNSATADPFAWEAQVISGAPWLQISRTSGSTPGQLLVSMDTTALAAGSYPGRIRITATNPAVQDRSQEVAVQATVTDPGLTVTQSQMILMQKIGAAPAFKTARILRLGGSVNWVATAVPSQAWQQVAAQIASGEATVGPDGVVSGGDAFTPPTWLKYSPDQGITPATLSVWADGTTPGTYTAVLLVVATTPGVPNRVRAIDVKAILANERPQPLSAVDAALGDCLTPS